MAENDFADATDLEETFNRAAKYLQTLVSELDSGQLLAFYGLYKQATVGPCDVPRPNWYQVQAKHKWEAWKNLGDMSRETAMADYIHAIAKINSSWEEEAKADTPAWISVSKLSITDAELRDVDKTFLDWVKEGNDAKVREMLSGKPTLVSTPDYDGLLPMHWAADRNHVRVMEQLIANGANVNSQDEDGQTPLHYAAGCGHAEAVKYLLSIGAQYITDNDGKTPKDVADEQVAALL
ncbi:acyl-CoA-binding domain-containing protein 6-like [Linepithema humile]|uniref:acyl-CoA-binding domain-containing protein 6-like n=1 Tax=Linepithema humile TaxID=83485 RepID=UPI0006239DD8|nr:PREDICTED: acyl-CoA-binding domain-containing protein 6-like [Linepithema humile]